MGTTHNSPTSNTHSAGHFFFLQCTLPDTNRVCVCVCVSLLASCAHSSSGLKNWLLPYESPSEAPWSSSTPMRTINKNISCIWARFSGEASWGILFFTRKSTFNGAFNQPPVYMPAVVSVALKGETSAAFSFACSWRDLGLGGAATGTLLGWGAGNKFFPSWRGQDLRQKGMIWKREGETNKLSYAGY